MLDPSTQQMIDRHAEWMSEAIQLTRSPAKTPFGCVLVDRRKQCVVASGLNDGITFRILHAEIVALQNYAGTENPQWDNITLYSTAEPCPMCQSAILWCGISETVFGTSIESLMRIGYRQIGIPATEVVQRSWAAEASVTGGVLEADCDALFEQHRRPL